MQAILSHYTHLPGDRDRVLRSLCSVLSGAPGSCDFSILTREDWELLGRMAVEEGVAPTIHYLLTAEDGSNPVAGVDAGTLRKLGYASALVAARNTNLFRELDRVVRALAEENIAVALLKGADLARSIYPNPNMRPMSDLDLLVKPPDLEQALHIAQSMGYEQYLPEASPGLNRLLSHHAHLRKKDSPEMLLELHWTLLGSPAFRFSASMGWFWEQVEPCHASDEDSPEGGVYCLNPTANLLYLAAHQMLQHGGERLSLRWLYDLHRLVVIRGEAIDWEAAQKEAAGNGWNAALAAALKSVQDCFGTPLPAGVIDSLLQDAGRHAGLVGLKGEHSPTRTVGEWKKLRSLRGWGRLRLFLTLIAPSPAYMRWRYQPRPGYTLPFYYLYRWLDIARDGWRSLRLLRKTAGRR